MPYRLGILASHPIQYYAPWFRYLAARLEIEVFYAHRQDSKGQGEAGFGIEFDWDTPLLEGYPYRWLRNVARQPSLRSFNGCNTPEVYDLIRPGRYDSFLVFGWNRKSSIQTIRACWRAGTPVLMRGDSQLLTRRSWLVSTIKYFPYRWFLPRMAAHLYVGQRNKAYLEHYGVVEEKLFFAPHFVDNVFFSESARQAEDKGRGLEIRSAFGILKDAFVFLFVGKMIPKKRPEDFVRTCLEVFSSGPMRDVHALLIGDGPLRNSLEILARPYAPRIHFAGFQNQSELPAFYKAANALVLPSDGEETWGLVVNEAFACGIPAVVSDAVGCAPDMIEEGSTGYTYPVGDVNMLTRRMLEMKKVCQSKGLAVREAVARKVAQYSIETATAGLRVALESVVVRQ